MCAVVGDTTTSVTAWIPCTPTHFVERPLGRGEGEAAVVVRADKVASKLALH